MNKVTKSNDAAVSRDPEPLMPLKELCIVLSYILCASLWIVFSDMALDWLTQNPYWSAELQTFKGLNFVAVTTVLLYTVLQRSFNRWRRAERKSREIEERFEFAGRAATDAIWDWNLATSAVWFSESFYQLFGFSREEIEVELNTSGVACRVHPEDKDRWMKTILQAVEGGARQWNVEYRFKRKDGSYAFVEGRGYVVRDKSGRALRAIGCTTDRTGSKLAADELERSRRQLRALSARLQSLREEERTCIAREIHDDLGQTLTALKMDLRWVERRLAGETTPHLNPVLDKIVEAGELANATIASVQRISSELRPGVLDDLGLSAALRHEAQRFQERTSIACTLRADDVPPTLARQVATAVFRVFQEALTNVARHAEATEVQIDLREQAGHLILQIIDNGKGIRASDFEDAKSLGLLGMKERAESLGGEVTFQPNLSGGTAVRLRVPCGAEIPSNHMELR
jgi:two-component system sensor histidine kinase UhpB